MGFVCASEFLSFYGLLPLDDLIFISSLGEFPFSQILCDPLEALTHSH